MGSPKEGEIPMPATISTLEELLIDQMQDLYDAEKQLVKALPKMAKAATSEELQQAIRDHLEETTNQVARLEQAFEHLEKQPKAKPCKAMRGLIEEGSEVIEEDARAPFNDLGLIAAAQRVEHYEISAYGTAKAMAEQLGQDEIVALLEETEEEEKAADSKLSDIAETLYEDAKHARTQKDEEDQPARKPMSAPRGTSAKAQKG
jgi:ferritin-like metal-binding protein YciE